MRDDVLKLITTLALQASARAWELQRSGFQSFTKKGLTEEEELFTSADLESQEIVVRGLRAAFPDVPIIAEEDAPERVATRTFFTVDPVDGTLCFSRQGVEWGCLIGFVKDGAPACGVLSSPAKDGLLTAQAEKGCLLNGKLVRLSGKAPKAIIVPTGPWTPAYISAAAAELESRGYQIIHTVSAVGSTFRFIRGEACAYFCGAEKIWDVAPTALAVQEAGGLVSTLFGASVSWDRIPIHCLFASDEQVKEEISSVLRTHAHQ